MNPLTALLFLLTTFLLPSSAFAQFNQLPFNQLMIPTACASQMLSGRDMTCDLSTWYGRALETEKLNCQNIISSSTCREFIKKEPILADGLKQCDVKSICADSVNVVGFLKGCASGFILGTGEGLDSIKTLFENMSQRLHEQKTPYGQYSNTIEYKRGLARGIPRYKDVSDNELAKLSAAFLLTERQRYGDDHKVQFKNIQPLRSACF